MDGPLISICIPNYNNGKYLDACIQSAIGQTYRNTEIILIDDCSTDQSMAIAKRYENAIRIQQNAVNIGQPGNTNKCVETSKGKYLVILHSDDQLLPDFVQKLMPILEKYPDVGMAVGERLETDESGIPRKIAPFYNTNCIIPGERQAKVFMMTSFLPCQVLLRRKTFDAAGGVDTRYIVNLDGLLWFKCALQNDVAYIQDPVSIYRIHQENTTAQYNQSIGHMMEYYCTLSRMYSLAKDRPYLVKFFDDAVKRIGQLALRYSHSIFRSGNFELAARYVALAAVFDPGLVNDHTYRTLKYCAESQAVDPSMLYSKLIETMSPEVRTFSHEPPDGFVRMS